LIARSAHSTTTKPRKSQSEQDGSEIRSVELERLIAEGLTLIERRDSMELFRDEAANQYERHTGSSWRPRAGSKVNHRTLTAAMIDSRDFLAAKRRAETEVLLPAGPKIAFTGGLDFNDHRAIWDRLDKVHAKHPDMVLLHGGSPKGAERIAACWATIAIAMSVHRAREAKNIFTYGSARWPTEPEIRAAGLLGSDGVVLGRLGRNYLRHDGPEHVLCFTPTRSEKGVGLVVPTLLTWPGSAIVHDIKGENWTLTAGWRSRFGRVLLFDPTNPESSAYNPLLEVRRGDAEVRDVQNVADILVDPEGALERRNHWEKTSHSLLVGAILHVLCVEMDKTLAGVANFLSDPTRPIETTLCAMMTAPHLSDRSHPVVASAARELLNKSENERSGVISTAMSFLGLYRDPVIAKVTCRCGWRIADLVEDRHPAALYLVVPPSDISRTKPLVRSALVAIRTP